MGLEDWDEQIAALSEDEAWRDILSEQQNYTHLGQRSTALLVRPGPSNNNQ